MLVLLNQCTTQIGSPILYLYLKGIKIGGCVLIIQIIISHAKKIPLAYPESIRLWTPRLATTFYVSLIVTQAIIRFPSKKKTKSIHPSSLRSVPFAKQQCRSVSKV
jgi:hypothetical protein